MQELHDLLTWFIYITLGLAPIRYKSRQVTNKLNAEYSKSLASSAKPGVIYRRGGNNFPHPRFVRGLAPIHFKMGRIACCIHVK